MAPIRVLMLISGVSVEGIGGGVARHVIELGRAMDPDVIQPVIGALWDFRTKFDQTWLERLRDEGLEVFVAAHWNEQAQYMSCVRAWRGAPKHLRQPVDIVHSHGEFSDLAAILLRRAAGARKLVRTVHNEIEWSKRAIYGKIFPHTVYPFAFAREFAVSRKVADILDARPAAKILSRHAVVAYNAVNTQRFETPSLDLSNKRQELGIPLGAKVVGSVGRLAPAKGYDVFLNAVPQILQQHPNTYFLFVGTGRSEDALRKQAAAIGNGEHVVFAGPRGDVEDMLGLMDVFVSSSHWEGLPTVVLESMASGTPVVGTNVSGTAELVEDGVTGHLIRPRDPKGLAEAVCHILEDSDAAQVMAVRAKERVQQRFSIQAVARVLEEQYVDLIGQRGPKS